MVVTRGRPTVQRIDQRRNNFGGSSSAIGESSEALFSSRIILALATIIFSYVFDNYLPQIN
jgi:hypothetical protein